MNGIKIKSIFVCTMIMCAISSCLEVEKFVQDVFVYEPVGEHVTIAQLRGMTPDQIIEEDIYVQGVVTSTDENGNYSQKVVFQDADGAISILAGLGSSHQLFPVGQKVSVQCKGLMLADISGMLCIASGIQGEGQQKQALAIDNRTIRSTMFAITGGEPVQPHSISLSELAGGSKVYEDCLVTLTDVFFQTSDLPFANAGGSSEQYRTLYDTDGNSILMCTSDGATMAGQKLPSGKGTVTGILTWPNGKPSIMIRSMEDISFMPSDDCVVNDPDDKVSDLMISEYYASSGAYYIEVLNVGTQTVNLAEYCLAKDGASDGVFATTLALEDAMLAPWGMVVYSNAEAAAMVSQKIPALAQWDPLRTNISSVSLDPLALDGNSQVALMKGTDIVDILSTTGKYGWAADKTLVRRQGIRGHSKASDNTRADAGWITKVAGDAYNIGGHRFYENDPDPDTPAAVTPKTIFEVRGMNPGVVSEHISVTGRITSDRNAGNVAPNRIFMQDMSNRGICVDFRDGQNHVYEAGMEISVNLYGAEIVDDEGLLVVKDCVVSRSSDTGSPVQIPDPIEASVAQLSNLQSMYVYLKDVQVAESALSMSYGDGFVPSVDLFANEFFLSTLTEADFAGETVAQSSGSVKGIASIAGDKLLVLPRNGADLEQLTETRFVPIIAEPIPVSDMKKYPAGVITDQVRVTVTVVSDDSDNNMPDGKAFVQDETGGFVLQLPEGKKYDFGQTLIVVLNNASMSTDAEILVVPEASTSVVAIGAPDPSVQPVSILPADMDDNLFSLVTVSNLQVSEADRLSKFNGTITFNAKGKSTPVFVVTSPEASWNGSYIPTASGSVTGLLTKTAEGYVIYPRKAEDLQGLPESGKRHNGENVVYFVPSTDPSADLFISEVVMGDLDANGNLLGSVARNKCNSKFVELYNPTGSALKLSDYRVACIKYNNAVARSDIQYYRFPDGYELTPGRTIVFKYVSSALGTGNTNMMTNTWWPSGYTGDSNLKDGVTIDTESLGGVILCLDARDYSKSIANSVKSFPAFDGNDILVIQKTSDGGATWTEIDRLFSLPTSDGTFTGKVKYDFLKGYLRKPGVLGVTGNVTDVQDAAYTTKESNNRNKNDFESTQCNPVSGGVANWIAMSLGDTSDLGVHTFSVK